MPECSSAEVQEDFEGEARLLSNFHHENIVSLFGVCFEQQPRLIVLEYLEGGDLKNFLRESRPRTGRGSAEAGAAGSVGEMGLLDLVEMALDVARACGHLEVNKFVHRDIGEGRLLWVAKTYSETFRVQQRLLYPAPRHPPFIPSESPRNEPTPLSLLLVLLQRFARKVEVHSPHDGHVLDLSSPRPVLVLDVEPDGEELLAVAVAELVVDVHSKPSKLVVGRLRAGKALVAEAWPFEDVAPVLAVKQHAGHHSAQVRGVAKKLKTNKRNKL